MAIQSSDLFLINRGGVNYKIAYSDLLAGNGILPTDFILVQRGGAMYRLPYEELSDGGATLESTDFLLVERGEELYSQRISGQLLSAGIYVKLGVNVAVASDKSSIVKFNWTGGRAVNNVPPQIFNPNSGKVVFLTSSGEVTLDDKFCQGNGTLRIYGQFDEMGFKDSRGLVSLACSDPSTAGWADVIPNPGPKMGFEMFDQCPLLTGVDRYIPLRNMTRMFRLCVNINDPNISNFVTGQVTTMRDCFNSCRRFDQPLTWNTSSVNDMGGMFIYCVLFDRNINNWSTGLVTDFGSMFYGCSAYNQPLYNWDTSSVQSFGLNNMFNQATVFNRDLKPWCVTAVKTKPSGFDTGSALSPANYPYWGVCP